MSRDKIFKSQVWPASGQFLSFSFIYLGLPLLAWGVVDLAGFFSNPVRISFTVIVTVQALILAWMTYITPPQPKHEHRFDLARWHAFMFEIIFVLAAFGDRRNILTWSENPPLRWVGLGIYLIGAILSISITLTWVNHLRREAEYPYDNPVLLSVGAFKWVRFPSLLYLILYCLGFAIAFRSWIGLALMIPLMGGIIHRIDHLERVFAQQYREVWTARRHTSKRIIPFLY